MTRLEVALSYTKALLRVFVQYSFIRSILVGAGRDVWGAGGAVIVLDLVSVAVVAWLEPEQEHKWPTIVSAVALTEMARLLVTTPHSVHSLLSWLPR